VGSGRQAVAKNRASETFRHRHPACPARSARVRQRQRSRKGVKCCHARPPQAGCKVCGAAEVQEPRTAPEWYRERANPLV